MERIKLILFFILLASGVVQAQVNRYMVFFKDKTGTPFTISNPNAFLSSRSIQRRNNQNISVTEQDLPVRLPLPEHAPPREKDLPRSADGACKAGRLLRAQIR
jgi:hypothetical protein